MDIALYRRGFNQVEEFIEYSDKKLRTRFQDVPSLRDLVTVLTQCLRVVWIPLDAAKDDHQAIFESLNDKGMRLSASELICSFLFHPLSDVPDFESLHNMKWLQAMRQFPKKDQFEEYLRYLFSVGERKMVGKDRKIYVHFKARNRPLTASSARSRLDEIFDNTRLYQNVIDPIEHPHADHRVTGLLMSICDTRMDSCTPFLLGLLRGVRDGYVKLDEARGLLNKTLTMLVRRKMTERPTTVYDTMFPPLFGRIMDARSKLRALQDVFRENDVMVTDDEFLDALVYRPLYRSRDIDFARMVLTEIDLTMQIDGQLPDYSTINTVEHVIPQRLDSDWEIYLGEDAHSSDFDRVINSLGNLCLMSQVGNSRVGRNPFEKKVNE